MYFSSFVLTYTSHICVTYCSHDNDVDEPIFMHQSTWQRSMLTRYGSVVTVLDATYNTTCYGLP